MRFLVLLVAIASLAPIAKADPAVASKPLAQVALYPQREASAQAVALNESRIAAEIAARIVQIPVEVGQTVARGTVVARLDCRDQELGRERANAALAATRSRLELAEQQLARARGLVAEGFISKEALDARDSEVEVLRADAAQSRVQLATAERAVSKCSLRAPFPAIVRQRLGQVGELAAPGTPLVALADASRIEVAAQLQPHDAGSLRTASEIRFLGDGGARRLKLLRISPAIDPQARTVEARLAFAAEAAAPGAAGRVVWRDGTPHLPPEIVVRRNGRLGVFLDAAGVARFHPLPEAQEGRPARVELPADARIVVQGQLTLQDGQRLR
jgi:RND family efflux transporter MFP subunit